MKHFAMSRGRMLVLAAVAVTAFGGIAWLVNRPSEDAVRDGRTLASAVRAMAAGDAAEARRQFAALPDDPARLVAAMDASPLTGLSADDSWAPVVLAILGVGDPAVPVQEAIDAVTLFKFIARSPTRAEAAILRALLVPLKQTRRYEFLNQAAISIEWQLDALSADSSPSSDAGSAGEGRPSPRPPT